MSLPLPCKEISQSARLMLRHPAFAAQPLERSWSVIHAPLLLRHRIDRAQYLAVQRLSSAPGRRSARSPSAPATTPAGASPGANPLRVDQIIATPHERPVAEPLPRMLGIAALMLGVLALAVLITMKSFGPSNTVSSGHDDPYLGFQYHPAPPAPMFFGVALWFILNAVVRDQLLNDPLQALRWNRFKNGMILAGVDGDHQHGIKRRGHLRAHCGWLPDYRPHQHGAARQERQRPHIKQLAKALHQRIDHRSGTT